MEAREPDCPMESTGEFDLVDLSDIVPDRDIVFRNADLGLGSGSLSSINSPGNGVDDLEVEGVM